MTDDLARPKRRKRLAVLAAVVVAAVALVLVLVVADSPDSEPTPTVAAGEAVPGQAAASALLDGIPQDGRSLGAADARVTLVEFADLQCPYCKQWAQDALPTVVRDYVRTGKVRLEFRPLAFLGPDSVTAASTVIAAGRQDKLWNVLDLLYANQGAENAGWVTEDLLTQAATAAGTDATEVRATAQGDPSVGRELAAADALATKNGLDSTPSFLLGRTGGKLAPLTVPALDAASFKTALDEALAG